MTSFVPRALRGQRSGSKHPEPDDAARVPAARRRPTPRQPKDEPSVPEDAAESVTGDEPSPSRSRGVGATTRTRPSTRPGRKVVAAPRTGSTRRIQAAELAVARLRFIAVGLGVWIVVFGLLGGAAWYFKAQGNAVDAAAREAMAAAEPAAEAIFSYDYRAFDESVADGTDYVTGEFAHEYRKTMATLEAAARKEKAVIYVRVSRKGIAEATRDQVQVLLFVNQYTRNVNLTGEKIHQNRVVLTMVRVTDQGGDHHWLVENVVAI